MTTASTSLTPTTRSFPFRLRHLVLGLFALMTLFVVLTRERTLLDPDSFLRQRYAPIALLMYLHAIPGTLALLLGFLQFSERIRRNHLYLHRLFGRIYVIGAAISAPAAVIIAFRLPIPTLEMASIIQATGWIVTTATGLYCIRVGNIKQHREWMIRSYPFALVFVVARVVVAIPAIDRMGILGLQSTVWTVIACACFLPSFILAWQDLASSRRSARLRATVRVQTQSLASADT